MQRHAGVGVDMRERGEQTRQQIYLPCIGFTATPLDVAQYWQSVSEAWFTKYLLSIKRVSFTQVSLVSIVNPNFSGVGVGVRLRNADIFSAGNALMFLIRIFLTSQPSSTFL